MKRAARAIGVGLAAVAIALLTGGGGAWASEAGCTGSRSYCESPSPSPTGPIEVTLVQPALINECEQAGVVLPEVEGVDWYVNDEGPMGTTGELNMVMTTSGTPWMFKIEGRARDGYLVVSDSIWTYSGVGADCPSPTPSPKPNKTHHASHTPTSTTSAPPTLPHTGAPGWLGWLVGGVLVGVGIFLLTSTSTRGH